MTIVFNNHTFKYEVESVIKLFFAGELFKIEYDLVPEIKDKNEDVCVTRIRVGKTYSYLYAYARINGKAKRLAYKISNSDESYTDNCEKMLCKLVFKCLSDLTGITPEWGILTGIRPVKRIIRLLDEGNSKEQIFNKLSSEFLISEKKLNLTYNTAINQKPLLDRIKPNSFSLYVSIPFCPSRCNYCSFVSHSIESAGKLIPQYISKLCEEIKYTAKVSKDLGLFLDTIYIGGGTPTSITVKQLNIIMNCITDSFDLSEISEYNVEAGRADTITAEKLKVIKQNGATRISINPQTFNNQVLKAIGRKHSAEDTINCFYLARELGFDNINMDLIAGLTSDTLNSFINTINKTVELSPENVTVHTLSLKRSADIFWKEKDLKENITEKMVEYSLESLTNNGYKPYYLYRQKNTIGNQENVGYSKPNKEGLYNIYIMEETQTILAVGAASSTKLVHPKKKHERIFNYKFPYEYINSFDEMINRKNKIYDFFNL